MTNLPLPPPLLLSLPPFMVFISRKSICHIYSYVKALICYYVPDYKINVGILNSPHALSNQKGKGC